MAKEALEELYFYELGLTYSVEKAGDGLLSTIAQRSQNQELRNLMHDEEGRRQDFMADFGSCFEVLGARPLDMQVPVVEGLRTRFQNFVSRPRPAQAIDLFMLGTALRFMYITAISYRELIFLSDLLGNEKCKFTFQSILEHKEDYIGVFEKRLRSTGELTLTNA